MKRLFSVLFFILLLSIFAAVVFTETKPPIQEQNQVTPTPTEALLGGDKDEHGCIPSAGYTWCEVKQKCLKLWEEPCVEDNFDAQSEEILISSVKDLLVEKHGTSAGTLDIKVSKVIGDYAQGSASEEGMGGGMWFASNVDNNWQLVWDGNGTISCDSLQSYPDFPIEMIPECYDETSMKMVKR